MAKQWKHWVRVVESQLLEVVEDRANEIIQEEDFDAVVPRISTCFDGEVPITTILLAFRKQVEE